MYTFWISKYNSCLKRLAFSVAFSKWQRFQITKLLSRYSRENATGIHVNTDFSREYLLKSFAIWNFCHLEKATEKARVLRKEFYFKVQKYTVWWKWVWASSSQYCSDFGCTRRFLGMTKLPLLPIRKLPEVSSNGQVSWYFMALGGIWKAFQVAFSTNMFTGMS